MPDPRQLKSGDPVSKNWREINALTEKTADLNRRLSRVKDIVAQLELERSIWKKGGGGKVEQFRFKTMGADTITCVRWDGVTEGTQVVIYKPWLLRRTPFDGKTRVLQTDRIPPTITVSYVYSSPSKRTKSAGDIAETQYITPAYTIDDLIYAVPCDQLAGSYLDINADGRAWAEGDQ